MPQVILYAHGQPAWVLEPWDSFSESGKDIKDVRINCHILSPVSSGVHKEIPQFPSSISISQMWAHQKGVKA